MWRYVLFLASNHLLDRLILYILPYESLNKLMIHHLFWLQLIPFFHWQIAWHHGSSTFIADWAPNGHWVFPATKSLASPAHKVMVFDIYVDNPVAVLVDSNIAHLAIDDLVLFFVIVIATNQALVIKNVPIASVIIFQMLWNFSF